MNDLWQQLSAAKAGVIQRVSQDIAGKLQGRNPTGRNQQQDDTLFGAANTAIALSIAQAEYLLARAVFDETFGQALEYEAQHGSKIHKGSITFNVAVAYLRNHQYPHAMHYFEFAQEETRATTGMTNWNIYTDDLFTANYWTTVDQANTAFPLNLYADFWRVDYNLNEAKADWVGLPNDVRISYIVANARRIRNRQLGEKPGGLNSEGLCLDSWELIADLARTLEGALTCKGVVGGGLRDMVVNRVPAGPLGDIKPEADAANRTPNKIHDWNSFNNHYPALEAVVQDTTKPILTRVAHAALIAGVVRNQIQHGIEKRCHLFSDRAMALFVIDVLMSLCRLREWMP